MGGSGRGKRSGIPWRSISPLRRTTDRAPPNGHSSSIRGLDCMVDLTYEALQRKVRKRLLRDAFVRGQGGPLVFLWAVGTGASLFAWTLPQYAAIWTIVSLGFAGLAALDYCRSPKATALVSRSLLETRFPAARF